MCHDSNMAACLSVGDVSMTEVLDRSTLWLQEKVCSSISDTATFFRA